MKQRELDRISLSPKYPAWRLKAAYVDRLRAEGVEEVAVFIDDVSGELTIKPVAKKGKSLSRMG